MENSRPLAMCYCGSPLVLTLLFSKYEFYCLDCGKKYGYFGVMGGKRTPELEKKLEDYKTEFAELSKGMLTGGVMLTACQECKDTSRPHILHATVEELNENARAIKRLQDRIIA